MREKVRGAARRIPELLRLERLLWDLGYRRVAGVDGVGLGPMAGAPAGGEGSAGTPRREPGGVPTRAPSG